LAVRSDETNVDNAKTSADTSKDIEQSTKLLNQRTTIDALPSADTQ